MGIRIQNTKRGRRGRSGLVYVHIGISTRRGHQARPDFGGVRARVFKGSTKHTASTEGLPRVLGSLFSEPALGLCVLFCVCSLLLVFVVLLVCFSVWALFV